MARTIGAVGKKKAEFDAKFDRACAKRLVDKPDGSQGKFNLLELMIDIAAGLDTSEQWKASDRIGAMNSLLNKRWANKRELTGDVTSDIPEQIIIRYDDSQRDKPVRTPLATVGITG